MDVSSAMLGAWILILVVLNAVQIATSDEGSESFGKAILFIATILTAFLIGVGTLP